MSNNAPRASQPSHESDWVKTATNLYKYRPSGIYFAKVRIQGKLFRKSLETSVMSVAKLRLADYVKEQQQTTDIGSESHGKMTVGRCIEILRNRLKQRHDLKEGGKSYREWTIVGLIKHWPRIQDLEVATLTKDDCLKWSATLAEKYGPTMYNNVVDTLRMVFEIGMEFKARANNPAAAITKRKVVVNPPVMPTSEQFVAFVKWIDDSGESCCHLAANMICFLAYSGLRKFEATNILWSDCDFRKLQINVRKEITKNGDSRTIPMIGDMKGLLSRLKSENDNICPSDKVLKIASCQETIDKGCEAVGMARITHHDLRHLFATRCIESGVDIPTVSRWLGHKDGGALAMKVYGHLRDQHSVEMAQKVKF